MRDFNAGNISGSIDIFEEMSRTISDDDYKNNLAYCLILDGRYEEAAVQFELLDLSFSMNAPLSSQSGIVAFLMGDKFKGIQQIREALSMVTLNPEFKPREVACMLVLESHNVRSVSGIPMDAAALINLFMMGGSTRDEMLTEMFLRYPYEGEQWIALTALGAAT